VGDVVGRLHRLHELVVQATEATCVAGILHVLAKEGTAALGASNGGVWLLVEGNQLVAEHVFGPNTEGFLRAMPLEADSPIAACVRDREPLWLSTPDEYAQRFPRSYARVGSISCACLPLLAGGRAIGSAGFGLEGARNLSEPERLTLALIVRQCAQALDRMRLAEAAGEVARRMTALQAAGARLSAARGLDEVVRIVIDEGIALIGANAAALWMRHGHELRVVAQLGATRRALEASSRISLDDRGVLATAMRDRTPVWLENRMAAAGRYPMNDARWDGIEAVAFVPFVADGDLLGALGVSFGQPHAFDTGERELIELFAKHGTLALAREQAGATQRLLAEASAALASTLDGVAALERLAELSVMQFADWCIVDIERNGRLERAVVVHASPADAPLAERMRKLRPPVANGVARAIATLRPTLVGRITDDMLKQAARSPEQLTLMREMPVRSLISAPMVCAGRAIGGITWASRSRVLDERDVALATGLAASAAVAFEHARLYEAEAAAAGRLGKLYELSAALSSAHTPVEVAQSAAALSCSALGAVTAMIWTRSDDGRLRMIGASGPPEWCAQWAVLPLDPAIPANRVLATGEPCVIETAEDYIHRAPAVYEAVRDVGRLNAFVAMPIIVAGARTGVMSISFPAPHRFTREERAFIDSIVRTCEQALDRAQLYVQEAEARTHAEMASRAKDEFLSRAGHALRDRLTPVVSAIELMRLRGIAEGTRERAIIERQTGYLRALIDDLLGTAPVVATQAAALERCVRSVRVLVVEDNVDSAVALALLLELRGHLVVVAHDGPGALVSADRDRPELAILDLELPGMDGYELARRLRTRPGLGEVPFVALTGYDHDSERQRALAAGFVEHLVKPIDAPRLYAVVDRFG
jgi:GAF domain-containing protein/CheY-like chemotaxis protein